MAKNVDNPLLRQMVMSTITPLRRSAFRLAAPSPSSDSPSFALPVESVWRWLRLDDVTPQLQPASSDHKSAASFDSEVASELLGQSASTTAAAPRQLLALLARDAPTRPRGNSTVSELPLPDFQRRLGDAVFISYVDAGEQSQLLWISHDSVRLQPTISREKLAADTGSLLTEVSNPATPVQKIMADATHLSRALLGEKSNMPESGEPAPSTLLVDAASPLAALPWSVLNWPNVAQPLLETTRISVVRIGDAQTTPVMAAEVTVLVAGQQGSDKLGALWNARMEPNLIATAIEPIGGHVETLIANDRAAVLDAFASSHSWLHVAAHGDARASRIGYAGIWLDTKSANESPGFVSWLEILARGSHNDLVVLNACDLAANPGSRAAALSFADAVSRAGARDVVAARWQVSDAATALWVPTFYRQMAEGVNPAEALWQVRRQLHDSRHFRHPFYWAAYVHYGHL
ncbi:MAG: CHAT domain-containing protein [Dokdonella sp.]